MVAVQSGGNASANLKRNVLKVAILYVAKYHFWVTFESTLAYTFLGTFDAVIDYNGLISSVFPVLPATQQHQHQREPTYMPGRP